MKIPLSIKQIIYLIIAILISAFLLSGLTYALISFASTGSDWVSASIQAVGNILGGILGGIVAIIVATYQVRKTFLNEQNKQLNKTITMLKLIREELRDNISFLESALPYHTDNYSILKTQLSDATWRSTMILISISDSLLVRLNVSYKKIALIQNLDEQTVNEGIIRETKELINTTLNDLIQEINSISKDIV